MRHLRSLLTRALLLFRRSRMEGEMEEEIQSHLDMAAEDYRRQGMDAEHARSLARRSFGGVEQVKERYRDGYRLPGMEAFAQDARYGLRTLRKKPGFTVIAVAMLALGIGINAAVFTVINAALFDVFPLVQRNDRIVRIGTTRNAIYYPDFEAWRAQAKSFQGMALVRGVFHTFDNGDDAPETYFTTEVTAGIFPMLGVKPMLGRDFSPADALPGAEPVVMLRYDVWANRLGANPAIVGQRVRIDGLPTTVIGVMPEGFSFPSTQALWTPLVPTPAALRRETYYAQSAFARMADGATMEGVRADLETIGRRLASAYPRTNRDVVPVVKGFNEWFIGPDAATLYKALWGAVGFVLLIVCANVANLLVAQAIGRSHEISIRLALGAGRVRIVRQFMVESLMLSTLSGFMGWWISKTFVRIYVVTQLNESVLRFTMDQRVLAYLIAMSIGTGLLAGLGAATYLAKLNIHSTSKDDGRGISVGKHGRRLSGIFVGVEMVLAVVLLASAGVISRSFLKVSAADVGVNTANVLTMDLYTPPERFPSVEASIAYYRNIRTRLQSIPGVESVGFGVAPTDPVTRIPYELTDAPAVEERSRPTVAELVASAGYFRALGARMISGRNFGDFDRVSSLPVAIVNQRFASLNWPGESPLGKRVRLSAPWRRQPSPWLTVVGVVSNIVQNDRTRQAFEPLVYVPEEQNGPAAFAFVRTSVAPASLAAAVRREIYAVDPTLRVAVLWPLAERLDRAYAFERNVTVLFLIFGAVALLLACVGLYAAISHSVSRRVPEIGIRMAIGATGRDIRSLVFKQGILPVGMGLAIGLAVSFAVNRLLKSQLVGVSPADPIALVTASVVLVLSAAMGCWIPARRATHVDPVIALKHE